MNDVVVFVPYGSRLGFHQNSVAATMTNIDYKFPQCVCYEVKMNKVKCLNQWDVQSKHVFDISGICETLYSGECRWGGGEHYIVYEQEQGKVHESVGSAKQETVSD